MLKVVLDTNVVSAHLIVKGPSAEVLDLGLRGRVLMFISRPVLEEYERVLLRPRFGISRAAVRSTLARMEQQCRLVSPSQRLQISADASDNRFYECAAKARARFLVTGNEQHFPVSYRGTEVVTPREFLEIWNTQ